MKNTATTIALGLLLLSAYEVIPKEAKRIEPDVYISNARALFQQNKTDQAETTLKEFQKVYPYDHLMRDSFFLLGEIERRRRNYLEAIAYYDTLNSRYPHSKFRIDTLYLLGQCYQKLRLYDRAEIHLVEYLQKEKRLDAMTSYKINAYLYLIEIMTDKRQYDRLEEYLHLARALLEKENKENSNNVNKQMLQEVYYQLGILYSDKKINKEQAHFFLNRSIAIGKEMTTQLKFTLRNIAINRLNTKSGLPEDNISDIKVDGDDVYIATWSSGLVKFSRSKEKLERIRLPSSQVRSLYIDDYLIYINTFDGIFIYDKRNNQTRELTQATTNKKFTLAQNVYRDGNSIFFTTLSNGVIEYSLSEKSVATLDASSFLKTNMVYCMALNQDYTIYGTVDRGVVIVDKKNQQTKILNVQSKILKGDNIKALLIDGRFLWIGVHRYGVYRYDLSTGFIEHFNWGISYPTAINRRENEIWVGSSGSGIRIFDKKTEQVKRLSVIEGLSANEISRIEMENNYVWVGYLEFGVDVLYRPLENTLGENR